MPDAPLAGHERRRARGWAFALLLALGFAGCDRKAGEAPSPMAPAAASPSGERAPAGIPATSPPAPAVAPVRAPAIPVAGEQPVPVTNMVAIRAGTFFRIKHQVTLTRDFWLGKYEVTQGEFQALTGRNPSYFTGDPTRPVEKVSNVEASAYCTELTRREREAGRLPGGWEYRLPTEAEWEFACRAGTTNHFSFGDAATDAGQYAWTEENGGGTPHPVGQKRPNPWGLHDMHGNVWEWCRDWFGDYPAEDVIDPAGPMQGQFGVFRGGGWNNEAKFARSGNRFMMKPANGTHFVGFRIALARTTGALAAGPRLERPASGTESLPLRR